MFLPFGGTSSHFFHFSSSSGPCKPVVGITTEKYDTDNQLKAIRLSFPACSYKAHLTETNVKPDKERIHQRPIQ